MEGSPAVACKRAQVGFDGARLGLAAGKLLLSAVKQRLQGSIETAAAT